ncbi:hypothetical protein [Aquamicrobium sp. LC103]|uniref:hypothetical protein n=1 Tax=Aquamicrobium sp. LC103 TaxID=1120658 RepID=UPI00063E9416|nr:hypothetical protein [Aquamicrobium sp. LC103]TKT81159.1 hypothetical protein XW59_004610 [Aquamicrobium sp. LC103]
MAFWTDDLRKIAGVAAAGLMLATAGCQSGNVLGIGGDATQTAASDERITVEELRAYCPATGLREGMSFHRSYQGNAEGDASKLIYQATITDITRSCTYEGNTLRMNVAIAGRIIPGPVGKAGTIRLPIRVVAARTGEVLYSQTHNFEVNVADTVGATQFVFNDANVTFPMPSRPNVQVFGGFDKGDDSF